MHGIFLQYEDDKNREVVGYGYRTVDEIALLCVLLIVLFFCWHFTFRVNSKCGMLLDIQMDLNLKPHLVFNLNLIYVAFCLCHNSGDHIECYIAFNPQVVVHFQAKNNSF